MRREVKVLPAAFAAALGLWWPASPAAAADTGDWDGAYCGDREEACMWRGDIGVSKQLSSRERDSYFSDDVWNNTNDTINDDVRYISNKFSSINVQGFREFNYTNLSSQNGTSCVSPGTTPGPYTQTSPSGLSSFRSCTFK